MIRRIFRMNYIKMSVEGNRLRITEDSITTGGSINYDRCEFTFDKSWDGFTKTAVFSNDGAENYRVAIENNACIVPSPCIERSGILQIGVFGISDDDVIITTNSVAHHVIDGIEAVGEWVEEDGNLVINAIKELKKAEEEYKTSLSQRVSEEIEKLKNAGGGKGREGCLPPDWYTPKEFTDTDALSALSKYNVAYEKFLDFRLNVLMTDYPDYVTREELGKDSSNENTLYAYSFTPAKYEKTILLATCFHGADKAALIAFSHFADCLCRDYENDETLLMLRERVKLIIIPAVSPYALSSGSAYNKNGINIAYNFPYKWDRCTRYKKGDAAADQVETQEVIAYLEKIKNDKLCAVVEMHTSNITYAGRTIYYTRQHSNCATALADLVNNFNYNYDYVDYTDEAVLAPSNNAYMSDYAADTYGVNACQLVWTTNLYGGVSENYCITKYSEFIGNTIAVLARNSRFLPKRKPQPFIKHISWRKSSDTDVFTVNSTSALEKMPISSYKMSLDFPCNIFLNGYVELNVSEGCTIKINPVFYQKNSSELDYAERLTAKQFAQELALTAGTHVIPISSVLQAYYSSFNFSTDCSFCEEVFFTLMFSASAAGKVKVQSFAVTLCAEPSDTAKPVEITSPIGLAADYTADDIPTQTVAYPLGKLTSYDSDFNN